MPIIFLILFFLLHTFAQDDAVGVITKEDFEKAPASLKEYWQTCASYVNLEESNSTGEFQTFGFNSAKDADRYYKYNSMCEWNFVGTSTCLPEIVCPKVDLRPTGCKDRIAISDGIGGKLLVCGDKSSFTMPMKASKGARDLFIRFELTDRKLSKNPPKKHKGFQCKVSCSKDGGAKAKPLPAKGLQQRKHDQCVCGEKPKDAGRVVGGMNATRNEFPWLVSIVIPGTRVSFCGGAVINSLYILTAAHCFWFAKLQPNQVEVLARAYRMDTINAEENKDKDKAEVMKALMESAKQIDAEEKTQRFKVLSIKNHPLFSEEFDYDVALLRLERPLDFTGPNRTTSICLPKAGDYKTTYAGSKAQVAGWGLLEDKGVESAKILQKLEVPVLDLEVCKAALSTSVITDRMLCAGFIEGGRDSCKGDSGGPLITQKANRYFEQIGIVSWGKGCARENRPGFYSRVTELTQWIQYNSNEGVSRWCKEVS